MNSCTENLFYRDYIVGKCANCLLTFDLLNTEYALHQLIRSNNINNVLIMIICNTKSRVANTLNIPKPVPLPYQTRDFLVECTPQIGIQFLLD